MRPPIEKETVAQPTNGYPRFFFDFVFRRPDGKRESWPAAAYTTELAERQARSLADLKAWTFIKVRKGQRLDWRAYYNPRSKSQPAWIKRAVDAYAKLNGG